MLDSDFTGSIRLSRSAAIIQNGHKLTIESPGIEISTGNIPLINGGILTSNAAFIDFNLLSKYGNNGHAYVVVESVIADSNYKVGLRIKGNEEGEGSVNFRGDQSNTFTGNIEISGRRNHLVLEKSNGAIAVRGDILVQNQAIVRFARSNQTLGTSAITLRDSGVIENASDSDTSNTLEKIIIEDHGVIRFNHYIEQELNTHYHLYIDDLIINEGGNLDIIGWKEGRDHLLVRKDSEHLEDALKKISIEGWGNNQVYLKSYNDDYWSIEAAPEPTTYGAILGTVGIALWSWRRKRRCAKTNR